MGGTSDGVGERHHTIRLRLLPALCVRHFVSQAALKPISRNVSLL